MKIINEKKRKKGAVVLLYVTIVAIIAALLMAIAQSQLLLAFRRNQSSSDSLVATYQAESIANDYIARFIGGYLDEDDLPFVLTFDLENSKITVEGSQEGDVQTITVTSELGFAVGKVQATREIQSLGSVENVDIVLALDCTGSMNAGARCPDCFEPPTRFDAQTQAAQAFVSDIANLDDSEKFDVGIRVFGIDSKWLTYNGLEVTPDSGLSPVDILDALDTGFGSTRATSPACSTVMDATSVGTPFYDIQDYFELTKQVGTKQIEIVITDGIPNSRIPANNCAQDAFCPAFPQDVDGTNYCSSNEYGWDCYRGDEYQDGPFDADGFNASAYSICEPLGTDFLRCSLARTDQFVSELGEYGIRDPEVDAYAVTIYNSVPREVRNIFANYTSDGGYFNASRADQLSSILSQILSQIVGERSIVSINKIVPGTE